MYKLLYFLNKYYFLFFLVIYGLLYEIIDLLFHNETADILLSNFIAFMFILNTIAWYLSYPLKSFKKTCDLDLLKDNIELAKKSVRFRYEKDNIKNLTLYHKYYTFGPSSEFKNELLDYIRSVSKYNIGYYNVLSLIFLEYDADEETEKLKKELEKKLKSTKTNYKLSKKLYEANEDKYDKENKASSFLYHVLIDKDKMLLLLYDIMIKHSETSEKILLHNMESENFYNRLDKVIIYYFLSIYYSKREDILSEKEALKKVIDLGNSTYMAKNARERLEKIETSN